VLLLGGQPGKGEGVICKVKAIIQASLFQMIHPSGERERDLLPK